jgi:ATP-dependent Clp protease ATP-binding subunit ClpA
MLVAEGYDPVYGARPLKRTLQRRILDPLAMRVLQGEFHEGDHVVADAVNGELTMTRQEAAARERG